MNDIHHHPAEAGVVEGLRALAEQASLAGRPRHAAIWENTLLLVEAVLEAEQHTNRGRPRAQNLRMAV